MTAGALIQNIGKSDVVVILDVVVFVLVLVVFVLVLVVVVVVVVVTVTILVPGKSWREIPSGSQGVSAS